MKYVGIDVHKKVCQAAILDEDGTFLDEVRFRNSEEGIEEFTSQLVDLHDEVRCVVESTGNMWIPVYDTLEANGFTVLLSNPSKTRLIAEAKVKTDRVDARVLARLLRSDMLCTCYVPGEEERSRRQLLRHRLTLVKTRTEIRNRVHSLLHKHGLRVPYSTPFSKKGVAWLRKQSLDPIDDAILRSDLALLEALEEQVQLIEEKIAALAVEDQRVRLLMTMTGVGYFTAMPRHRRDRRHRPVQEREETRLLGRTRTTSPPVRREDLDRRGPGTGKQAVTVGDGAVRPHSQTIRPQTQRILPAVLPSKRRKKGCGGGGSRNGADHLLDAQEE